LGKAGEKKDWRKPPVGGHMKRVTTENQIPSLRGFPPHRVRKPKERSPWAEEKGRKQEERCNRPAWEDGEVTFVVEIKRTLYSTSISK